MSLLLVLSYNTSKKGIQIQTCQWHLSKVFGHSVQSGSLHWEVGSDGILPQLTVLGCIALFRLCTTLNRNLVVFSTIEQMTRKQTCDHMSPFGCQTVHRTFTGCMIYYCLCVWHLSCVAADPPNSSSIPAQIKVSPPFRIKLFLIDGEKANIAAGLLSASLLMEVPLPVTSYSINSGVLFRQWSHWTDTVALTTAQHHDDIQNHFQTVHWCSGPVFFLMHDTTSLKWLKCDSSSLIQPKPRAHHATVMSPHQGACWCPDPWQRILHFIWNMSRCHSPPGSEYSP